VSLAAAPVHVAAVAGGAPRGDLPGLAFLGALAALGRAAWRWLGLRAAAGDGALGAGSRRPRAVSRVAQLPATALLLTAMLLVPATALAQIPTQEVEYYHTDALGSVRAVTKQVNGTWQVVARHDFMPFGEEVAPPVPPQAKRLFTGKERDHETGLDYFEARYLGGGLGRFSTIDPLMAIDKNLVEPQQWNRYAYVRNNPLAFIDPTGAEIELLADSRDEAFAFFRDDFLLGDKVAASMLDVEEVKRGGKTRYMLTIKKGKMAAFMQRSAAANWLGDLIRRSETVEFGFTTADLSRWGGARTLDPAEHGVEQPRVLVNRQQVRAINETAQGWLERFGGRVARDFTEEIVVAHELGHWWALIHGRGPVSSWSSDAQAVYWENRMREWYYREPLGPKNPPRLRHGIWR
jgi:RHS repeat-associated protein